jgi:thermostable 8-oxoguanine DNA glycosylase
MNSTLIDPKNITNYNRSDSELETFWLFCLFVAGKNSDIASLKLSQFLEDMTPWDTPFSYLKSIDIHNALIKIKSGQYTRLSKAITQSLDLDLKTCSLSDLNNIYGVGPKTSRFFLLHTRRECEYAVLDTHILKWVKNHHGYENAPKNTPQNPDEYEKWSNIVISLMNMYYPDLSLADIDLLIWAEMSGRLDN